MSSAFDSPIPDLRIKCANCGVIFFTRYADQKYHSLSCKESAAQKRKRARARLQKDGLSTEGTPASQSTVVNHPVNREAFLRDIRERLASPRMQWQQEFIRQHGRLPLDTEFPADLHEPDQDISASEQVIKELFGPPADAGGTPPENPE